MLKLPKGLKKKKKGKKSKKDQELFTEEELEQYRREHQNQSALNSAAPSDSEDQPGGSEKSENDEEWSKFAALTSGIDSVLKKTQGDLDRIKSTSFFQKVPTKVEQEAREREERERREQEERERAAEVAKAQEEQRAAEELINAVVELSESEPNSEAEEDIFDTGYIDAIASGELPIAYVPESPVLESFEGEDPFDTSYAEKVIKGPEVSKRGKKIVNIGSAVEVLTGRVESVGTGSTKGNRQRRGIQNLLLASFDEGSEQQQGRNEGESRLGAEGKAAEQQPAEEPQTFSLLDDSADLPADVPIDLSVSLHLSLQKQQQEQQQEEGESHPDPAGTGVAPELDLDEFDDLKKRTPVLAGGDDFELLIGDAAAKERIPKGPTNADLPVVDLDEFEDAPVDDPFDTGFVERILPATAVEDDEFDPRAEEPEVPEDDFDFDPRAAERDEKRPSTPDLFSVDQNSSLQVAAGAGSLTKDLLSGSSSDLAGIAHAPLECTAGGIPTASAPAAADPFDTSDVEFIVAPGKTELKFLEEELLTDRGAGLSHSLSDPDFDPRGEAEKEDEHTATQEEQRTEEDFQSLAQRKSSLSLHISNGGPLGANRSKSVVFAVPTPDLLKLDGEQSIAKKPLTPYYNREPSLQDVEVDPFDTSFVPSVAPTQLELSLLEQELNSASLHHSLSDPEFDPRADSPTAAPSNTRSDLLGVSEEEHLQKVLTPARGGTAAAVEADPFDTSIAVNLQPGRAELKLLEDELIPPVAKDSSVVSDILSDGAPEASSVFVKVLTPQASNSSIDLGGGIGGLESEEIDPFDTSFVPSLGPGRAEIKLLESELIDQ
ncbi:protein stoned-A [Anopheles funestus]|uniref:protein stoned-A n=1 Tax=Anopheles funestus TaxID=62324 RepID=UPI0020C5F824|nr:protein stoned-A [Anopheles funestus]